MQEIVLLADHPVVRPPLPPHRPHPPLLLEVLRLRHRQGEGENVLEGEHPAADAHTPRSYYWRRFNFFYVNC